MKKLLWIVVPVLLWCNFSFADEDLSVNGLLKKSFKITKEELYKTDEGTRSIKVITLKKNSSGYAVCTIKMSATSPPRLLGCLIS